MAQRFSLEWPTRLIAWRVFVVGTIAAWSYFFVMGLAAPTVDPWRPLASNENPWANGCRKVERRSVDSPDASWRAVALDFSCVRSGVARFWTTVVVARPGEQLSDGYVVLSLGNLYGDADTKIRTTWSDAETLRIGLPKDADVFDHTAKLGALSIILSSAED